MLQNAYFLAKIGADTAENEQTVAEISTHFVTRRRGGRGRRGVGRDPRASRAAPRGPPSRALCLIRSEVNSELNFPPKLRGARSRLYRRRFLQVNTRWKALAEIYTMHSFAPFSNLNFFVKNRQNFFAIELMNIH